MERRRRLTGTGHLVVTYRAQALGADALPLEPEIAPRDRYLVAASAVAAEVRPLLEVEIPETGKLLVMSGALPPPRVGVVLDVKAK